MLATSRWALRLSRQQSRRLTTSGPRGPSNILRKRPPPEPRLHPARRATNISESRQGEQKQVEQSALSTALHDATENHHNSLVTPVHIPEDPHGVLKETHPAMSILANSSLVVQRQLEMMNVLMGFEQANRYVIMDAQGNHVGYLAERDHGLGSAMMRQMAKTHRSFTTHVFDRNEREVLRFHRPFSWISSRIRVYDALSGEHAGAQESSAALQNLSPGSIANQTSAQVSPLSETDMRIIGEAQQQWAPLRQKYNLFLARDLSDMPDPNMPQLTSGSNPMSESKALEVAKQGEDTRETTMAQFAYISESFLSWDYTLLSADSQLIGSVNRNWGGLAREMFTDTGAYVLRMDAAAMGDEPRHVISQTGASAHTDPRSLVSAMTLDQRAVMLATAVSIDFDHYSRHSRGGAGTGGFMPIWFPWGGGAAGEAGAAGSAGSAGAGVGATAGEAGVAEGAAGAAGNAARGGIGMSEGVAGAGTMAGYEAMQRMRERSQEGDDASPTAADPYPQQGAPPDAQGQQGEEVWGEQDPWAQQRGEQNQDGWGDPFQDDSNSGGGDGGGGGSWTDFFGGE